MRTEPAAMGAMAAAIINAVVLFGLDLTANQGAAIVTVVTLAAGFFIRSKVTPVG